jgi:hypothetical protein
MTGKRLGHVLSYAAWILPAGSIAVWIIICLSYVFFAQHDPPHAIAIAYVSVIALGGCSGIVGLIGIPLWGDRYWVSATIGTAVSASILLIAFFGGH